MREFNKDGAPDPGRRDMLATAGAVIAIGVAAAGEARSAPGCRACSTSA